MTLRTTPRGFPIDIVNSRSDQSPTTSRSVLKWSDVRDGVENPRFKQAIRSGSSATTRLTGTKQEIVDVDVGPIFMSRTDLQGKNPVSFSTTGLLFTPSFRTSAPSLTSANNAALGKYYSSARSAMTAMQGMTFLGEIAETIHLLKRPGSALRSGLSDYLRSLKKAADGKRTVNQLRKALSSTYLEYVFGWVPLIRDGQDALKAYQKLIGASRNVQCRGFGSSQTQVQADSTVQTYGFTDVYTKRTLRWTAECQVIYYGAVKGVSSGVSLSNAADLFGFRIDEFVPTLWEILPWSFLVDYFTNIGDIVSATCYVNANLAWTSKTTRIINSYTARDTFDLASTIKNNPSFKITSGGGQAGWTARTTDIVRDNAGTVGIPSLEFSLPGSNARWANITALLAQSNLLSKLL